MNRMTSYVWQDLHAALRSAPSQRAELCTYRCWWSLHQCVAGATIILSASTKPVELISLMTRCRCFVFYDEQEARTWLVSLAPVNCAQACTQGERDKVCVTSSFHGEFLQEIFAAACQPIQVFVAASSINFLPGSESHFLPAFPNAYHCMSWEAA